MTEGLLTIPSRDHGIFLWKLVSTAPAAIKLPLPEKTFQKTVPYSHRSAPYVDHQHLKFMNDETLIYTLDLDLRSIPNYRFFARLKPETQWYNSDGFLLRDMLFSFRLFQYNI
jgi:hypothetical protein